jgi:ankyrin repeat protein
MFRLVVLLHLYCAFAQMAFASQTSDVFYYAEVGNLARLADALKDGGDVNRTTKYRETLLMRAAIHNQLSVVKFLLNNGANIAAKDRFGFTVTDYLESNIHRAGVNRERMIDAMKQQGLSAEAITRILSESNETMKTFTEKDKKSWGEILEYIRTWGKAPKPSSPSVQNRRDKTKPLFSAALRP